MLYTVMMNTWKRSLPLLAVSVFSATIGMPIVVMFWETRDWHSGNPFANWPGGFGASLLLISGISLFYAFLPSKPVLPKATRIVKSHWHWYIWWIIAAIGILLCYASSLDIPSSRGG